MQGARVLLTYCDDVIVYVRVTSLLMFLIIYIKLSAKALIEKHTHCKY